MYALSIGEYFGQAVQGINVRVVAVIILTLVMMVNIIGVKNASIVQQILVVPHASRCPWPYYCIWYIPR